MPGIFANNNDFAFPPDYPAAAADFFYRWFYLHYKSFLKKSFLKKYQKSIKQ